MDTPDPDTPTSVATTAAGRTLTVPRAVRWWTWPVVVTAVFLLLQPLIGGGWALFSDSYRYAKQAEIVLGMSQAQAHEVALHTYCDDITNYRTWHGSWIALNDTPQVHRARVAKCLNTYAPRGGDITSTDPRYQSIFTTRPGYPLVAAPFIAAFGIVDGLRILGFVLACGGGILAYAALRAAGLRAAAAAAGQVVYLATPLGWWALQALGEGLVDALILGAVAGIMLMRRGRPRWGVAVIVVSWAALAAVRFSTLLLVAAALAVGCAVIALAVDRHDAPRRRSMWVAVAVNALAVLGVAVAMPVLHLPGASVTLQDTFTSHFARPLVPDPWYRLAAANYHFWPQWLTSPSVSLPVLCCAVIGSAALAIWRRDLLWLALALFGAGAAQVAAHPLPQEAERLGLLMWMPAVLGAAVIVHALTRRITADVTITLADATPRGGSPHADRAASPALAAGARPARDHR